MTDDQLLQDSVGQDLLRRFKAAEKANRLMGDKFVGIQLNISHPTSGKIPLNPAMVGVDPDDLDDNMTLGDCLNFPKRILQAGRSISSKAYNTVRYHASSVPSFNGHMVHKSKIKILDTELLALKGLEESDNQKYDSDIIEGAEEIINVRLAKRTEADAMDRIPVTFLGYCNYLIDNYERLCEEILEQYADKAHYIRNSLPSIDRLRKYNFKWKHYAEVPSLMMFGESSFRNIVDDIERGKEAAHQSKVRIQKQLEDFQIQCRDALTDVQKRVRSEVAVVLRGMVKKIDNEKEYKDGIRPENITESHIERLKARIDGLAEEAADINSSDQFYTALQEFRSFVGIDQDYDDAEIRQEAKSLANRVVEISLNEDEIDSNTGQFYRSIL